MKKVILGAAMFLAGAVSAALILAGSMANDLTVNGYRDAMWNISEYGLMPFVCLFGTVAIAGLAVAVWGLLDKNG